MIELLHAADRLRALLDPDAGFETIASGFVFTEGPAWQPATSTLTFSDLRGDARWSWRADRGARLEARPAWKVNGATVDLDGSVLLCEHVSSSVVRVRADGAREIVAFHFEGTYLNSPNDVVVRSDGSVWFTDSNYGRWRHIVGVERPFELGFQGVYRVPPGGGAAQLVVARDEFEQPNGLCFSPDESVLYVDDVDDLKSFDVRADDTLGPARVMCSGMGSAGAETGNPDGMRCDEHGNVWVAARDGVWVFDRAGELLGIVRTPEVCANLTWGGDDWRTLFLCTSTTVRTLRTRVASDPRARHGVPR
ncbi:SMP-30/gluconolactonase/LRE family protein [Microbacterium immunditiarum]|uniref:Sugar lactone lactonase YvrE n=1 Tax=Microbacterium immunditiarum TaxID=337480 RepID=A0A7Y9GKX9_9MICO|nr:SMP-30/gluconolactonase/LRE family protein [Microbacterium immunditiarum]NYE18405.1 sugar lactone lactonase YvrE [Microbacterium immunditiarum]